MQKVAEDIQAAIDSIFDAGEAAIEATDALCRDLEITKGIPKLVDLAWALASKAAYDRVTEDMDEAGATLVYQHLQRKCLEKCRTEFKQHGKRQLESLGEAHLLDVLPVPYWRIVIGAE